VAADNDAVASLIEGGRSKPALSALPRPANRRRAVGRDVNGPVPGYNGSGRDVLVFERAL
jgi:hypothetical protein